MNEKMGYFLVGAGLAYAFACFRSQRKQRLREASMQRYQQSARQQTHALPMAEPAHYPGPVHPRQRGLMERAMSMPGPTQPPPAQQSSPVPNGHDPVQTPMSPHVAAQQQRGLPQQGQQIYEMQAQGGTQGSTYETAELYPGAGATELQGF